MSRLAFMPGVDKVVPILDPFKLASRNSHPANTVVKVSDAEVGGDDFTVMAGPCSIESHDQLYAAAETAKKCGCKIIRGGAFKARTSPYSFQGLGEKGLKIMKKVTDELGLKSVVEALSIHEVGVVAEYCDIIQIGARNMQNFALLKAAGKITKPILLKRGMMSTIEELLLAAEYLISSGNPNVILCERGIRTFEKYTRNTLDISAVAVIKHLSHLPIIVDPTHAVGVWSYVAATSKASLAAGADGLLIEIHPDPANALCDGEQSLTLPNFEKLMQEMKPIAEAVGRKL
jgi:3-deoxy-7-phosphoheptulonate synthase